MATNTQYLHLEIDKKALPRLRKVLEQFKRRLPKLIERHVRREMQKLMPRKRRNRKG